MRRKRIFMNQKYLIQKKHVASVIAAGLMFSTPILTIAIHPETALAETISQDKQAVSYSRGY